MFWGLHNNNLHKLVMLKLYILLSFVQPVKTLDLVPSSFSCSVLHCVIHVFAKNTVIDNRDVAGHLLGCAAERL